MCKSLFSPLTWCQQNATSSTMNHESKWFVLLFEAQMTDTNCENENWISDCIHILGISPNIQKSVNMNYLFLIQWILSADSRAFLFHHSDSFASQHISFLVLCWWGWNFSSHGKSTAASRIGTSVCLLFKRLTERKILYGVKKSLGHMHKSTPCTECCRF